MTSETMSLGDIPTIPDLSGIQDTQQSVPFEDGWYAGTILAKREFTDSNGNDRVFESDDAPAQSGNGRNVRLQVEVKRQDGRTLNTNILVNYQTEDLSQETVQAIAAAQAAHEPGQKAQWGNLFRPFMTLVRLGKLQRIAGVRQLARNGNGGLDLSPLYGRTAFIKLGPDRKNPELYKEVKDFSDKLGPKTKLL